MGRRRGNRRSGLKQNGLNVTGQTVGTTTTTNGSGGSSWVINVNWIHLFLIVLLQVGSVSVEVSNNDDGSVSDVSVPRAANSTHLDSLGSQQNVESIYFSPLKLDFGISPVGMARLRLVRVYNQNADDVKLISISGSTVHFHASFFADKVIAPGGNTTFEVVFLSRGEGFTESTLNIHTSHGMFIYHVEGYGTPNPYRLKPMVGAMIPLNGTYEPMLTMHNPHDKPIQIVEMLSSEADLTLSLPAGGSRKQGENNAWALQPFETKPVMQGSFYGRSEGSHNGYIKIRVNSTKSLADFLLVPVEIQVNSGPGIYSPQDSLDFGLLTSADKPRTLPLSIINAEEQPVSIKSVSVNGYHNSAVRIEFRPLVVEPDRTRSTVIALITFTPGDVSSEGDTQGLIEIRSEDGHAVHVPFLVTIFSGEVKYNLSALSYFVEATNNVAPRNFSIQNNFTTSMAVYHVAVSHQDIVQVERFNSSQILQSGEQLDLFRIRLTRKTELCEKNPDVQLTIMSNITTLHLPVTCYDGKLSLKTIEGNEVNFGRIETYSTHVEYFAVGNNNPVEIRLKSWGSNSTFTVVELVGMQKGRESDLGKIQDFDCLKKSLFLQPDYVAIFSIHLKRPAVEGSHWGQAYVTTDHNQTLRVPFRCHVSKGCVHSDILTFDNAFPGKISLEKLHLVSTFNQSLGLRGLKSSPSSSMWFTSTSVREPPEILPHRKNYVGKVHFDPKQFCGTDCYTGFRTDSKMGISWVKGIRASWEAGLNDVEILKILKRRYDEVRDITVSNLSLWVETSDFLDYKLATQVSYSWPYLTPSKTVSFPLTALGNESIVEIPIINPSNSPVMVQALLALDYGPLWSQLVDGDGSDGNSTEGEFVFTLGGLATTTKKDKDKAILFAQTQGEALSKEFGLEGYVRGIMFELPPGSKYFIRANFKPISKGLVTTLLVLRNNLTGIETAWLKGQGGTAKMTLGRGEPGSSLRFELTEKLLEGCKKEPNTSQPPPVITVRRSFIARNVGELPLEIKRMEIPTSGVTSVLAHWTESDGCEGYGFRILNCQSFTILPNQTYTIDIAFTPGFTTSKVVQFLNLFDANGLQFNFTLLALVPRSMLRICSDALPRPPWEISFRNVMYGVAALIFCFGCTATYIDAGTIMASNVVATVKCLSDANGREGVTGTRLDLRAIYQSVENRFRQTTRGSTSQVPAARVPSPAAQVAPGPSTRAASTATHASTPASGSTTNNVRNRRRRNNNNLNSELNLNNVAPGTANQVQPQRTPDPVQPIPAPRASSVPVPPIPSPRASPAVQPIPYPRATPALSQPVPSPRTTPVSINSENSQRVEPPRSSTSSSSSSNSTPTSFTSAEPTPGCSTSNSTSTGANSGKKGQKDSNAKKNKKGPSEPEKTSGTAGKQNHGRRGAQSTSTEESPTTEEVVVTSEGSAEQVDINSNFHTLPESEQQKPISKKSKKPSEPENSDTVSNKKDKQKSNNLPKGSGSSEDGPSTSGSAGPRVNHMAYVPTTTPSNGTQVIDTNAETTAHMPGPAPACSTSGNPSSTSNAGKKKKPLGKSKDVPQNSANPQKITGASSPRTELYNAICNALNGTESKETESKPVSREGVNEAKRTNERPPVVQNPQSNSNHNGSYYKQPVQGNDKPRFHQGRGSEERNNFTKGPYHSGPNSQAGPGPMIRPHVTTGNFVSGVMSTMGLALNTVPTYTTVNSCHGPMMQTPPIGSRHLSTPPGMSWGEPGFEHGSEVWNRRPPSVGNEMYPPPGYFQHPHPPPPPPPPSVQFKSLVESKMGFPGNVHAQPFQSSYYPGTEQPHYVPTSRAAYQSNFGPDDPRQFPRQDYVVPNSNVEGSGVPPGFSGCSSHRLPNGLVVFDPPVTMTNPDKAEPEMYPGTNLPIKLLNELWEYKKDTDITHFTKNPNKILPPQPFVPGSPYNPCVYTPVCNKLLGCCGEKMKLNSSNEDKPEKRSSPVSVTSTGTNTESATDPWIKSSSPGLPNIDSEFNGWGMGSATQDSAVKSNGIWPDSNKPNSNDEWLGRTSFGFGTYSRKGKNSQPPVGTSRNGRRVHSPTVLGSGSEGLGELSIRRRRMDDENSQRELEAGLGFNPFTTNIWNPSDKTPSSDSGWPSSCKNSSSSLKSRFEQGKE